jgi:nickel superoxide dismutase
MKRFAMLLALAVVGAAARPAFAHCQIPCGIYDDALRIRMLREDIATVEKSVKSIVELSAAEKPDLNQLVRWVTNKEEHAQKIQDMVAEYFMTQRVKVPAEGDEAAKARYFAQLSPLHRLLVAAMKMKQTTDMGAVTEARKLVDEFAAAYFTPEDLKHLEDH